MEEALLYALDDLQKTPLFRNLEAKDLTSILTCFDARIKRYPKGQIIELASEIYQTGMLLEGSTILTNLDYFGNQTIVSVLSQGDFFGAAFDFSASPVSLALHSQSDCRILFLDGKKLACPCQTQCGAHIKLLQNTLGLIAERNVRLCRKIEILSKRRTRDKLLSYLLWQSETVGAATFEIPYDRQGLADFLCVERSALSSVIGALQKEGLISAQKNRFTLLFAAHAQNFV